MNDCSEYRRVLEDIVGAYFEHGDGPGLRALLQDANRMLIDSTVSHRHEGWQAGDATEYVLAQINRELRESNLQFSTENSYQRERIAELEKVAVALWGLLDDIDTASDAFRDNYRSLANYVYETQRKRFQILSGEDWYKLSKVLNDE